MLVKTNACTPQQQSLAAAHRIKRSVMSAPKLLLCLSGIAVSLTVNASGVSPEPLKAWQGEWRSYYSFLIDPAMEPAYQAVHHHTQGFTLNGVRSALQRRYFTHFSAIKITGSTINFLDNAGQSLGVVPYRAQGTQPSGHEDTSWTLLEAQVDTSQTAGTGSDAKKTQDISQSCRYVIATDVHDEHWHLRCGARGFEALLAASNLRWPTLLPTTTQRETIIQQITDAAQTTAKRLGEALEPWYGEWVSASTLMADPAMEPAFEKIAAEARKLGKKYDAKSVRDFYIERFKTDYDLVQVSAEAVVYKKTDGTVIATCHYVNDGQPTSSEHWIGWIAKDCPGMNYVVATPVHGEGSATHWHWRFSDDAQALKTLPEQKGWTPTGYDPKRTTAEDVAKRYMENAEKFAANYLPE